MTWPLWVVLILVALTFAAVGARAYGEHRWAQMALALRGSLDAGGLDAQPGEASLPARYDARELEGLPAVVQRYFRTVLHDGQPIVSAVTIDVVGRFNMSPISEQWKPFSSRQRVVTRRPGFVWDARIRLMPGVTTRVVDSYIAGKGLLRAAIEGLFTVADVQGEGEIARGEFMRWFAEAAWYPTALLPSQGVHWAAVDDHRATATVVDSSRSLSLLFRFNDAGLIGSFRAEARGGMVGQTMVMAPWEGIWSNYQTHEGMLVPLTGEVAWMRPEGRRPYFVGTVTAMAFEFAPPAPSIS